MTQSLILALCAAAALTACGGGDDNQAPPPTAEVPASASMSTDGFVGYLSALVASPGTDSLEPVDVSSVNPPADDDGAPSAVD